MVHAIQRQSNLISTSILKVYIDGANVKTSVMAESDALNFICSQGSHGVKLESCLVRTGAGGRCEDAALHLPASVLNITKEISFCYLVYVVNKSLLKCPHRGQMSARHDLSLILTAIDKQK